jgi:Putative adhesin
MPSALSPRPSALLAGVCALTVLGGCDVTIKDGDVSFGQLHGRATQEFNRKYPLAAGGRVEVINASGPVDVITGPSGSVLVAALLSARAMTDVRAKELLSESRIEESATPEHVKLTTVRGNRSGGLQVNYKVVVPSEARVEITANNGTIKVDGVRGHVKAMGANGAIELSGLRGSVDAALVNGAILVKMAEVTARVRLEGTNGRIALEVPKDAKAMLNARSVNGGLTVTGLTTQEATGRRIRNLESVLNGGGPEIDVRVTNGRITIEGK